MPSCRRRGAVALACDSRLLPGLASAPFNPRADVCARVITKAEVRETEGSHRTAGAQRREIMDPHFTVTRGK